MLPIRVLLGWLPTSLQNAVEGAIRSLADVEVVGVAIRPTELLLAAGRLRADVVIVATADDELPGIASHLLDQYPHIKVLAVAHDGQQIFLYALRPQAVRVLTPSLEDLVSTIRSAVQNSD